MMGIGGPEIVLLMVLGLLLFGASHLPRLGRSAGKTITEFKRGVQGLEDEIESASVPAITRVEPESIRPPQRITDPARGAIAQ